MADVRVPSGIAVRRMTDAAMLPPSDLIVWLPTIVGCAVFTFAWFGHSGVATGVGAAVCAGGLAWVPVALALQHRLATMARATLLLGGVLIVQGMHTVEHVVQLIESYRLNYPPARSLGVVSQLNVEWVHFGWNWFATAGVFAAYALGRRGKAMWALMVWIVAHSLEHTYLLVRYLSVTRELDRLGVARLGSSEVLPGFFGRDGWLALHAAGQRELLGPFVSAPRVAVHLWWNVGEVALVALPLLLATRRSARWR